MFYGHHKIMLNRMSHGRDTSLIHVRKPNFLKYLVLVCYYRSLTLGFVKIMQVNEFLLKNRYSFYAHSIKTNIRGHSFFSWFHLYILVYLSGEIQFYL